MMEVRWAGVARCRRRSVDMRCGGRETLWDYYTSGLAYGSGLAPHPVRHPVSFQLCGIYLQIRATSRVRYSNSLLTP